MLNQNEIELGWIFRALRRWIWAIAICVILATVLAFIATADLSPEYEATATLLIQPAPDVQSSEYNTLIVGERLAQTYTEMLKGHTVLQKVISEHQLGETSEQLAKRVTIEPVRTTQLIHLTVKDTSPDKAVLLANAIGQAFISNVRTLQTERYEGPLKNLQDKMEALSLQMNEIQAKIQTLTIEKNDKAAKQAQQESLLADDRSIYQQLQQDYQTLQLNVTPLTNGVSIAETARASSSEPAPTAVVTFIVDQTPGDGGVSFSAETYGRMLASRSVIEAAIKRLGLEIDAGLLGRRTSVATLPGTQLIQLSVVDSKIEQAILLANTIAEVFIDQMEALHKKPYTDRMNNLQEQIHEVELQIGGAQVDLNSLLEDQVEIGMEIANLEDQLAGYRSDYRALQQDYTGMQLDVTKAADAVVIAEPASVAEVISRNRWFYIALAALITVMMTCSAALVIEYLYDVVRTPEDVSHAVGLSTLGSIGMIKGPESGPVALTQPRSPDSEAFRVLATNLLMTSLDRPLRTILVTSPHAQDGKSLVMANLAAIFAQRELSVVAVDADLRLPRLHHIFEIDQGQGLTDALLKGQAGGHLKSVGIEKLRVLTSGDIPPNPAEVVASGRMRKLLDELVQTVDLVLIDCPPVLQLADAAILASIVDGVVIVIHAQRTRRQELREAVENLRKVGAKPLGVVLNRVPSRRNSYYKYYGIENRKKITGQHLWKKSMGILTRLTGESGSWGKNSWNRKTGGESRAEDPSVPGKGF